MPIQFQNKRIQSMYSNNRIKLYRYFNQLILDLTPMNQILNQNYTPISHLREIISKEIKTNEAFSFIDKRQILGGLGKWGQLYTQVKLQIPLQPHFEVLFNFQIHFFGEDAQIRVQFNDKVQQEISKELRTDNRNWINSNFQTWIYEFKAFHQDEFLEIVIDCETSSPKSYCGLSDLYIWGSACKGLCKKCISNFHCEQCYSYYRPQDYCDCHNGKYANQEQKTCDSCTTGCLQCQSEQVCEKCDRTLGFELRNQKCQCMTGMYLFQEKCTYCDTQCIECTVDTCVRCRDNKIIYRGKCICPQGQYLELIHNQCMNCYYSCRTCVGPKKDQCLSCTKDRTLQKNQCQCTEQQYNDKNTQKCENCVSLCKSCANNEDECTSCYENYYFNEGQKKCLKCDRKCVQCFGEKENQCLECLGGYNYEIYNFECQCKLGYFQRDSTEVCQEITLEYIRDYLKNNTSSNVETYESILDIFNLDGFFYAKSILGQLGIINFVVNTQLFYALRLVNYNQSLNSYYFESFIASQYIPVKLPTWQSFYSQQPNFKGYSYYTFTFELKTNEVEMKQKQLSSSAIYSYSFITALAQLIILTTLFFFQNFFYCFRKKIIIEYANQFDKIKQNQAHQDGQIYVKIRALTLFYIDSQLVVLFTSIYCGLAFYTTEPLICISFVASLLVLIYIFIYYLYMIIITNNFYHRLKCLTQSDDEQLLISQYNRTNWPIFLFRNTSLFLQKYWYFISLLKKAVLLICIISMKDMPLDVFITLVCYQILMITMKIIVRPYQYILQMVVSLMSDTVVLVIVVFKILDYQTNTLIYDQYNQGGLFIEKQYQYGLVLVSLEIVYCGLQVCIGLFLVVMLVLRRSTPKEKSIAIEEAKEQQEVSVNVSHQHNQYGYIQRILNNPDAQSYEDVIQHNRLRYEQMLDQQKRSFNLHTSFSQFQIRRSQVHVRAREPNRVESGLEVQVVESQIHQNILNPPAYLYNLDLEGQRSPFYQ